MAELKVFDPVQPFENYLSSRRDIRQQRLEDEELGRRQTLYENSLADRQRRIGQEDEDRAFKKRLDMIGQDQALSKFGMDILTTVDPDAPDFQEQIHEGLTNFTNALHNAGYEPEFIDQYARRVFQSGLATPDGIRALQEKAGIREKPTRQIKDGQLITISEGKATAEPVEGYEKKTSISATPTDIDDFVERANLESIRVTGKELTPGKKNEAALQFKRAQENEVRANKWAEKEVDALTEKAIKYNGEIGKQLAVIETAGKVLKAKGEITPEQKKLTAKKGVAGKLASLASHYVNLNSMDAIVNTDKPSVNNILASIKSSSPGQFFGKITGTSEQSIRNAINNLRPLLLQDIRQSTDMGARGLDSEKELEFYMQAATDPTKDIQANIAAIVVLDESYGNGEVAEQLRNLTDESLISSIADRGQQILNSRQQQTERIKVKSPNGQIGTIPANQLQDALNEGYIRAE